MHLSVQVHYFMMQWSHLWRCHRLTCSVDVSAQYPVLIVANLSHWPWKWLFALSDSWWHWSNIDTTLIGVCLALVTDTQWHRASVTHRATFFVTFFAHVHRPNLRSALAICSEYLFQHTNYEFVLSWLVRKNQKKSLVRKWILVTRADSI